ncbi:nectin-1-like [Alosa sapidissima]|uniref:nectin-1-like n=1 Tax=Alosa sapidissima TaxID=34773 RepID=UPI001C08E293|nr:nectin-1-like [Alosa sapidissima]
MEKVNFSLDLLLIWFIRQCVFAQHWRVTVTSNHMCVPTGSTAVIPCSFTHPSDVTFTKAFWTLRPWSGRNGVDLRRNPAYSGRVHFMWDESDAGRVNNVCTLRLSGVKRSDSARYYIRITTQEALNRWLERGPWLSVTGYTLIYMLQCYDFYLQLAACVCVCESVCYSTVINGHKCLFILDLSVWSPPRPVTEGHAVKLKCKNKCTPWSSPTVVWKKNGEEVNDKQTHNNELLIQRVSHEDMGYYSCALKGHEGHPSKPVRLNVLFSPKFTSVSVSHSNGIHPVTLTCSSDANPPVESYTWFKVNESSPVGSGQQYSITNISSEDGGQYYCEARNKYGAEKSSAVSITDKGQNHTVLGMVGVAACVVLGVSLLTVFLCMRRHSKGTNCKWKDHQNDVDYVNDPQGGDPGAIQMSSVYQSLNPNTTQPDGVYQSLNPNTIQPDGVYQSLNPNTIQPDGVYQTLNPNTTQPDGVYQTLNPNTTQPDAFIRA